ncbi:putative SPX domain-containing protein [Helianthus annuus]|nr:putative SPX domain-containing protein [Helianthus annuus]KAJ0543407.1 putative SPX domain-containing protein [Helianthus annuus]KAJ0708465.1 putative SPX domain-containing protein [Helianthus annuus]KAJ0712391.1 putative SPX domain-containing protein [Helianthus annuus]KAJ0889469.1 putative SPX domain-containing protein [Helianthus annuus]
MKFGKEFALQTVPEWREAYMNYNYLKTLLEQILIFRQRQPPESQANRPNLSRSLKRKVSLFRAFSGLRNTSLRKHKEDEIIVVNAMQQADEEQGGEGGPSYQTIFLRSSEEGGDLELVFFKRLDNEFNKVIHFYKTKVQEVVKQADELSNQMDALIALRIKVNNPIIEVVHDSGEHKMASLDVLDRVKINATIDTPMSTVRSVFNNLNLDLNYNKNELKDAQGKLKQAFLELYEKLRYLKNYAYLNQMAFSKIMKKYDKITSRNASDAYLEMVEETYLSQSDEVAKLIERVEAVFIKHFCNGDRQLGMNTLRPKSKREKHWVSFFVGCFFGCSLALVAEIIISIHARDLLQDEGQTKYMNTIFPLYSLFGFLGLHMLMYAGNVYFWARYRVNYSFIFGFKQGTELDFKQVLLLTFGLSVLILSTALANLEMEMDPETQSYKALTELLPLGLVIVVVLMAICPFNILYRTNRFFFLTCVWHCLCAPLYLVTLPDFFLADQFTSQVQLLRNVEFYACYYGWGDFKKRDAATCNESNVYKIIYIVIAVVPYWIRFLQCIRRYCEGRDSTQAMNGLKYLSTIAAVVSRTIYTQKRGTTLKIIAASTSGVATIFNTYWDLVMDWCLLCRNSENPWLRDKLILPNKSVYFIAMVLNAILRLAWMQTVLDFNEASFLHTNALIAVVASLEIIRRGIWNFFRLENEHLNNVGKFRAVKSVPLPFSYEDKDKDL